MATENEGFEIKFNIDNRAKKGLKAIKENPDEVVKGERKEQTVYTIFMSELEKFSKVFQLVQQIKGRFGYRSGGSPDGEFITPFADPQNGIPPLAMIHSKAQSGELLSFVLNPYIIRVIPDDKLDELPLQDEYKKILERLCFVFQYGDWNPLSGVRDLIRHEYTKEKERLKNTKDAVSKNIMQNYQQNTNKDRFSSREEYFYAKQRERFKKMQNKQELQMNYATARQDLMLMRRDYAEKYKDLAPKLHYYSGKQIKVLRGSFRGYMGSLLLIDNGGRPPKTGMFLNRNFFMGDLGQSRVFSPTTNKLETGQNIVPIFVRSTRKGELMEKIGKKIKKLLDKVQITLFDNPMIFFDESGDERTRILAEIQSDIDKIVSPRFWEELEIVEAELSDEDMNNFLTEDIAFDFSQEQDNSNNYKQRQPTLKPQPDMLGIVEGFNRK